MLWRRVKRQVPVCGKGSAFDTCERTVRKSITWLLRLLADERCDRIKSMDIEGRIQYARGWGVVPEHLAKLLRPHRLRCGDADGLDVRGGNLDRGGARASVGAW